MIHTKKSQFVFILPFHPSPKGKKGKNEIGIHHLFTGESGPGGWKLRWGDRDMHEGLDNSGYSAEAGLLNVATESALRKTLRIWEFNNVSESPSMKSLELHQKQKWSICLDGETTQVIPGWIRIIDTTQDIALAALQLSIESDSMESLMKAQRKLSTSHRSSGWSSSTALVATAQDEKQEEGILYFHRKTSEDGPVQSSKTTVNRLLRAIAKNAIQHSMPSHQGEVRLFSSRNVGFHAMQLDCPDSNFWVGIDLKLQHHGYHLMQDASPSWGQRDQDRYHCDNPADRHSFWIKHDAVLLCITGDTEWTTNNLFENWSKQCDQWFLSFILTQAYLFRANEMEDQLKETVANNRISTKVLSFEEKKFEEREWEYLQLNWTLNHKLLHMDPKRRTFHEGLRRRLNVDDVRQSLDNQTSLIRAWYTQSFQNVTKKFVQVGATLGIVTGLLGINVSGLTSDDTGLSAESWWIMTAVMIAIYVLLVIFTLFANPLRRSIWDGLHFKNKGIPEKNPESC